MKVHTEKRRDFHKAYQSGLTPHQIGEKFGYSEMEVVLTLRQPVPKIRGANYKGLKVPVPVDEVVQAFYDNTLDQLANKYHLTRTTLLKRLPEELRVGPGRPKVKKHEKLSFEEKKEVLEVGCGDFVISSKFVPYTKKFIAGDIFDEIIEGTLQIKSASPVISLEETDAPDSRKRFEISTWAEKAKLLNGFEDERYRELSQRLINYLKPEFSSNKEQDNYHEFLKERLLTNGPWKLTLEKAISRTNSLKIEAEGNNEHEKLEIINSLLNHYQEKKSFSEL